MLGEKAGTLMQNRIDLKRPDAPELAAFGPHAVGVSTRIMVNPGQIDVQNSTAELQPRYDRELTVEYWYPAATGTQAGTRYQTILRDGHRRVTLQGMAERDAAAGDLGGPLVIISHGFPGNRMLLAHFAEHLASHGYRVASIDHKDSTYDDPAYLGGDSFPSTLVNRPLDTGFVAAALGGDYAIIGYSMGGYGALVAAGAGVAEAAVNFDYAPPAGILAMHRTPVAPDRLKAIIPIGPWGRHKGFWDAECLGQLQRPCLIMAGSGDDVSDYEGGMRKIFDEAGAPVWLLTFEGAEHNAAAPIPAPTESWEQTEYMELPAYTHYADPVWDNLRMNNIAQHFALAFLDLHLKGLAARAAYLAPGWKGFAKGRAPGLRLEQR